MIKRVLLALAALALCLPGARADFAFTLGTGPTAFSFTSTTGGTALCAAASTHCFASVPINTAGAQLFTSGNPGVVSATGLTQNQPTSGQTGSLVMGAVTTGAPSYSNANTSNLSLTTGGDLRTVFSNATIAVTNAGTFAVQSATTLGAETTKVIGTVRNVGNVGGVLDAIGQNVAAPANWLQGGCQFNTSPTTITSTNGSPLQCDNGGKLLVAANIAQVNGTTVLVNTGATGTGSPRVTVATDQATNAGAALVKGGIGVVNGGSRYQHVAASQTAAVLQSSTGATGDYLSHCVVYPGTTGAGSVTVYDNTNSAANNVIEFVTGTLSNLAPISIPVGAISRNGAWKIDTGANETVVCYGSFS